MLKKYKTGLDIIMQFCNRKNLITYFLQKSKYHNETWSEAKIQVVWSIWTENLELDIYLNPDFQISLLNVNTFDFMPNPLFWISLLDCNQSILLRAQNFKISRASDWLIEFCNQFYTLSGYKLKIKIILRLSRREVKHWSRYPQLYSFQLWTYFFISVFYVLEIWILAFSFLSSNLESRWGKRRTLSFLFIQWVGDFKLTVPWTPPACR